MKLSVSRSELNTAVASASRAAERTSTIPILKNLALDARGQDLVVAASDTIAEIRVHVPAEIERPGATTVPAALLSTLVGRMPAGRVTIESSADGATTTIAAGRTRASLQCLPIDDFPSMAERPFATTFGIEATTLVEALATTTAAMSDEVDRIYLNGIFVGAGDGGLVAVATNGHRLGRWRGSMPHGGEGMSGVIIPRATVAELGRLAGAAVKSGGEVGISLSNNLIRVSIGEASLTSKLIDATFIDWQRLIPKDWKTEAVIDRQEAIASIERVKSILIGKSQGLRLSFSTGRLTISARNADAGTITEDIAVDGDAEIEIGFQAGYIQDALEAIDCETVRICMQDPASPALILPVTQDPRSDRLVLLMPMRV